jgi:CRP/FNR family transcriptional regulator
MKDSRKEVARTSHRNRPKHTIQKENFEYNFEARVRAGPPDRKLIQKIIESGEKASYKKGAVFFAQGEKPPGIFLVLTGAIKLYISSSEGRSFILGFKGPGSILGLASTILGRRCEATAETTSPTTAISLRREALLKLLQENTNTALETAELLSERCFKLLDELRNVTLSDSAEQRLAAFVLRLQNGRRDNGASVHLLGAKQEDLALMVRLCRETTSRALSRLKRRQILDWGHSTLVVRNWDALQKLAVSPPRTRFG